MTGKGMERRRERAFIVAQAFEPAGGRELSSPVLHPIFLYHIARLATGKSREPADWKVCYEIPLPIISLPFPDSP